MIMAIADLVWRLTALGVLGTLLVVVMEPEDPWRETSLESTNVSDF